MGRTQRTLPALMLFKQPFFTAMMENNIFYHMYYLPYVDYSVNLPSCLSHYRDVYIKNLKRNNSWFEYRLWRRGKQYPLLKSDVRYR